MRLMFAVAAAVIAAPAPARAISGSATVIDGDTLEIDGQRVRLFAIDAPEASQTCENAGRRWQCGEAASERLRALIGNSEVACEGDERDQFGRLVAVCRVAGVDLNQAMVADGWATAFRQYSNAYGIDEDRARAARSGLWASTFEAPADYRAETRQRLAVPPRLPSVGAVGSTTGGCLIKGNHSRRGEWIYHLPGMPYYEQTRAEEMFCSEAQAVAAGYRKSRAR